MCVPDDRVCVSVPDVRVYVPDEKERENENIEAKG